MKKFDLGQLVTILANIGVIAGIVFLAVEISQNTTSAEVSAYQDMVGQIERLNELAFVDAGPFVLMNANSDATLDELTPENWEKVVSIALIVFRHGDMAYFQSEKGLLSPERLHSILGPVRGSMCVPIYQEIWEIFGENYVQRYRDYVDGLIDSCRK